MGNLSPPGPRMHLISSRSSSTFIGLAQHEAGWPWVDSMSRSKAYRHVSCFYQRADNFQRESTGSAACSRVNKIKKIPVIPIAAVRAYLLPKYFLNCLQTKLCNIAFPLSSVFGGHAQHTHSKNRAFGKIWSITLSLFRLHHHPRC